MGEAPEWWVLIQAAKYLGVPPWDLEQQRPFWLNAALASLSAENDPQVVKAREMLATMRAKVKAVQTHGNAAY